MSNIVFYHAGCDVCINAENKLIDAIGDAKVEIVHFAEQKDRIDEAVDLGVKSVPALVVDGSVLHINFGASMDDVRKAVA